MRKHYGAVTALDGIDLDVAEGEFVTLLGASGSGKTTTLQVIAGFLEASSGSVWLGGADLTRVPSYRRDIGVVFQNYALFPHLSVADNVGYSLAVRKVPKAERRARVEQALDMVRLGGYGERRPGELSGGQQQRVAIARAVVFGPRVLLMDEPMGALDKSLREALQLEVVRIHRELGVTVVYVTHDQEEALSMSNRIAVYHSGRILQMAAPRELYEQPADRYVAEFVGESNTFRGVVVDGVIRTPDGDITPPPGCAEPPGAMVDIVVRPDAMRVTDGVGPDRVSGVVTDAVYVGASTKVIVVTAEQHTLRVRIPGSHDSLEVGATLTLGWSPDRAKVFRADGAEHDRA